MMKKLVLFFAVAAMVSFVACTGSKTEGTKSTDSVAVTEVAAPVVLDSAALAQAKADSIAKDSAAQAAAVVK